MWKTTAIACVFVAFFLTQITWAEEIRIAEPANIDPGRASQTLIPTVEVVRLNENNELEIDLLLRPNQGLRDLRNPLMDETDVLPARLVVFDEQKKYVGDLLVKDKLGLRQEDKDKQLPLPEYSLSAIGRRFLLPTGEKTTTEKIADEKDVRRVTSLGRGTYQVQAIYTQSIFRGKPDPIDSHVARSEEIGRSEIVSLQVPVKLATERHRVANDSLSVEWRWTRPPVIGERASIAFHFVIRTAHHLDLYNPSMREKWDARNMRLEIFDAKGALIGEFLESPNDYGLMGFFSGPPDARKMSRSDWVCLPPHAIIVHHHEIKCGAVPKTKYDGAINGTWLPPGKYGMRLTLLDHLTAPNPWQPTLDPRSANAATREAALKNEPTGKEVARSKIVEVEFKAAEAPTKDEWDLPLVAILKHKDDALVANAKGMFRANLERQQWEKVPLPPWEKLTLPPEMPTIGFFGRTPPRSNQILFCGFPSANKAQKAGLYGSTDAGRTWKLISEHHYLGPITMLDNDSLVAIILKGDKQRIEMTHDMGKTWQDITESLDGVNVISLSQDPDHGDLICIATKDNHAMTYRAERFYQVGKEKYFWRALSPGMPPLKPASQPANAKAFFAKSLSIIVAADGTARDLRSYQATLRNYFQHDFGDDLKLHAIHFRTDKPEFASFVFRAGEPVAVPIIAKYLENVSLPGDAKRAPAIEKLLDHPSDLGLWGFRVEFGEEQTSEAAATSASRSLRDDPDRAGRVKKLQDDTATKVVELSAAKPYQRTLDIGKLHDFSKSGEYRVQLIYDSTGTASIKQKQWVGEFSSTVFNVTIKPRD